eukprot:9304919-Pyramimonas_sp.AAC.1
MRIGAQYGLVPLFGSSGLPAGDVFNDIFVRVYSIGAFDRFIVEHPEVWLSSYVDDNSVTSDGTEQQ